MKLFVLIFMIISLTILFKYTNAQDNRCYRVINKYYVTDNLFGKDYISISPDQYIYIAHGNQVNILNESTGDSVGVIPDTFGVHGIAFASMFGKGYTSNGLGNNVTAFDIRTHKILAQIGTGDNPDAIFYDEFSKKIVTSNGSNDLSIIDPVNDKLIETIPLGGSPETGVSNGTGKIYINLNDKNEIVVVNIKSGMVEDRWSTAPGKSPTALAVDKQKKRLFVGCDKMLVIMDATNGAIIDSIKIGPGCDGVAFDSVRKITFASCSDATLNIIHATSEKTYKLISKVQTIETARALILDQRTHQVFLPAYISYKTSKTDIKYINGGLQILVIGEENK